MDITTNPDIGGKYCSTVETGLNTETTAMLQYKAHFESSVAKTYGQNCGVSADVKVSYETVTHNDDNKAPCRVHSSLNCLPKSECGEAGFHSQECVGATYCC